MDEQQFINTLEALKTICAERKSAAVKTYTESEKSEQDYWNMVRDIDEAIYQFDCEVMKLHFRFEQDRVYAAYCEQRGVV